MQIFLIIGIILGVAYYLLMLLYRYGWHAQAPFSAPSSFQPRTGISVIIPARNEAANIDACLQAILSQNFPKELLEIIVLDDHSDDATAAIVKNYQGVRLVLMQEQPAKHSFGTAFKKQALDTGIRIARFPLIITTDADCIAPPNWLRELAALQEKTMAVAIIAPVSFISGKSIVNLFQSLDFMSLQGITAAAQQLGLGNMANGANFAFQKEAFLAVKGYEGFAHFASGDDYVLLHKLKQRYPNQIHYLKSHEAIMNTQAQPDWASFFKQRIRWASKSGKYPDHKLSAILGLVYLFNCWLFAAIFVLIVDASFWWVLLILLLGKTFFELLYLIPISRFFSKQKQLWLFPFLQLHHITYIVLAGLMGLIGNYQWKGRKTH